MNEIINPFLLVGDKFISEMNLRQSEFMCSACGPFTKSKARIKTLKKMTLAFNIIQILELLMIC